MKIASWPDGHILVQTILTIKDMFSGLFQKVIKIVIKKYMNQSSEVAQCVRTVAAKPGDLSLFSQDPHGKRESQLP